MMRLRRRTAKGAGDGAAGGRSISQKAKAGWSTGRTALFFGVFLVVGLGFLLVFAIPAWKVVAARGWAPVDCEILSSSVGSHAGEDGSTYSVDVRYRYRFEGVEYTGERYDFLGGSSSGYESKKEVVDALPEGSTTTCWVDPDEPSESVLYRGLSWVYLFALLPLVFVAIGGGGVAWALSSRLGGGPRAEAASGAEAAGSFHEIDSWATPVAPSGPVELEEKLGPVGKLGCLVVICLFWNGIVSVFVWQLWSSWRSGAGLDGCLAVFLIPFVLIGLVLLVGVPYQLLALANPRPRLTLSRAGVPLGGSAQLDWRFRGSTRRLRDLRIRVVGSEKASYRRGTTTHTDSSVFAEIDIVEIGGDRPLGSGSVTFEIPADTMHSFEAPHNKIVWVIRLSGSIAWWPDVGAEFPLVVEPGAEGGS